MAKNKGVMLLSDNILGEGMREKLTLRRDQLQTMLDNMNNTFKTTKTSLIRHRAIVYFLNGRVDPVEFELATQVLDAIENDLFALHDDIAKLSKLFLGIEEVLTKINKSKDSEDRILQVQKFLNSRNGKTSSESKLNLYLEDLSKIKNHARLLEHSATALIELKAGK